LLTATYVVRKHAMSLPSASAALGLAFLASTSLYGIASPEPGDVGLGRVIVPVAALAPVAVTAADVVLAAASDEAEQRPGFGGPRAGPTPLLSTPPQASPVPPAGPSGLQPVQAAPGRWPAQTQQTAPAPARAAPRPAAQPVASPQQQNAQPAAMPQPVPAQRPAPARTERPRVATQVHGFDGIVASERALLQKTASSARYEAHIASAATEAEAEQLWSRLHDQLGAQFQTTPLHMRVIDVPGHGRFVRLLAGDFQDAETTAAFCRAVISAGRDCRILRQLPPNG